MQPHHTAKIMTINSIFPLIHPSTRPEPGPFQIYSTNMNIKQHYKRVVRRTAWNQALR
jgi:hypothetical protein